MGKAVVAGAGEPALDSEAGVCCGRARVWSTGVAGRRVAWAWVAGSVVRHAAIVAGVRQGRGRTGLPGRRRFARRWKDSVGRMVVQVRSAG